MSDEYSKGLPYKGWQPLDFYCGICPARDCRACRSRSSFRCGPCWMRATGTQHHLPGNGQRQVLPGAARSIAADREGIFTIRLTGERLYGRIMEILLYLLLVDTVENRILKNQPYFIARQYGGKLIFSKSNRILVIPCSYNDKVKYIDIFVCLRSVNRGQGN